MTGHVHEIVPVSDDVEALQHKPVDHLRDLPLVARDRAGRKDDPVARHQADIAVIVLRNAGQGGSRFALAAGGQDHGLLARQAGEPVRGQESRYPVEIAAFARNADHPVHGTTDDDNLPPCLHGGFRHGPQPRHVRREGRDRDAARSLRDQPVQRGRDLGLRRAFAVAQDVGGIAHHGEHALVAERPEPGLIGRGAKHGGRIDLPIARVHHQAGRRADREGGAFRDRVSDGNELDIERGQRDPLAELDGFDPHLRHADVAGVLGFEHARRKRRGEYPAAELGPELGERPDVVLMRMRDDHADEVALDCSLRSAGRA